VAERPGAAIRAIVLDFNGTLAQDDHWRSTWPATMRTLSSSVWIGPSASCSRSARSIRIGTTGDPEIVDWARAVWAEFESAEAEELIALAARSSAG
jgi:hypothetical protein